MITKEKIWLIVAASLVLFSALAFVIVMSFAGWDFSKLSTVKYETREVIIAEDFNKISISIDTADLDFLPSEDDKIKVVATEQENITHSIKVEENTLKIESSDKTKWYERIQLFNFGNNKIKVYLPKDSYESLNISSSTGDIGVPKSFTFRSIDIETSTASVNCSASSTGELKIKVSTGDISVGGAFYSSIDLHATTGDIELSNVTCVGDIALKVGTGKTNANSVTCNNFVSASTTGKINLNTVFASSKMEITTGTGDIALAGCDAGELNLKASTGDITGTLLSDKYFDAHTSTGEVSVPASVKDKGICKIRTTTGDIIINIAKK